MRFETPNAVMERFDGSREVALWRTEMAPGAAGPSHIVDLEQVVLVLDGTLTAETPEGERELRSGESLVLPPGVERRLRNAGSTALVTVTSSLPGATARVGDADPVPIPWAA